MTKNTLRIGNFTSSEIWKLFTTGRDRISPGKPYLSYVESKNFERRLGRSIAAETYAKPTQWGKIQEQRAFDILPMAYTLNSDETLQHPEYDFWVGSPDGFKCEDKKAVCDIKCPYTLLSFCQLVEPIMKGLVGTDAIEYLRDNHDDGEKYYRQLVSNACITGCDFAELIIYMPYKSELEEIKVAVDGNPDAYFISMAKEDELPYIMDDGEYKNINIIRFPVTAEMKAEFEEVVSNAGKLLINRK